MRGYADVETVGALFVAICSKPARPLGELAPNARPAIAAIVKKALELDVSRRYASAAELLDDLKKELPSGITIDESMLAPAPYPRSEPERIGLADTVASAPPLESEPPPARRG